MKRATCAASRRFRVALVAMPWLSAGYGSAALSTLKAFLLGRRIRVDNLYLNVRFARRLGFRRYQTFANNGLLTGVPLVGEWFFSKALFGAAGTRELSHDFSALLEDPAAKPGIDALVRALGVGPRELEELMDRQVAEFLEDCVAAVEWERYSLVGFSSVFWNHVASLALARRLKERHPSLTIVFGGANVHGPMGRETLRSFPFVDYVVDGEGELPLEALARELEAGREPGPIAGVARRRGDAIEAAAPARKIDLDELPGPYYRDYLRELEAAGFLGEGLEPHLPFQSSRGCWFGAKSHCVFCGLNGEGMAFRSKSGERLAGEVLRLHRRFKVRHLHCADNILDMRYFETFLPAMRARMEEDRLDLSIYWEVKSNLRKDQIALMAAAGIRGVYTGIESIHAEILRLIRKGVTPIQNVQALKFMRQYRIHAGWALLHGVAGERAEHYDEMLEQLPLLTHLDPPDLVPLIADRFSPYHSEPGSFGIRDLEPYPVYSRLYPPRVDLRELAYHFSFRGPEDPPPSARSLDRLRRFSDRWHRERPRTFFFYTKGLGFLDLHDYRLRDADSERPEYRKLRLRPPHSEAYELCDSARSSQAVCRALERRHPAGAVRRALDDLCSQRLVFREGDSYLSLALPAASLDEGTLRLAEDLDPMHVPVP